MTEVAIGEKPPEFELPDTNGNIVRLSDFIGTGPLVVFFYPKDFSGNCTKEACAFRDNYETFKNAGAEVLGISSDSIDSHKNFASRYYLPYNLLSDTDGKVRESWGVPKAFGVLTGRVTYILDKDGVLQNKFASQVNIAGHIGEVLTTLEKLAVESD